MTDTTAATTETVGADPADYVLTWDNRGAVRRVDNMTIPFAWGNSDFRTFIAWVSAGNEPDPYGN